MTLLSQSAAFVPHLSAAAASYASLTPNNAVLSPPFSPPTSSHTLISLVEPTQTFDAVLPDTSLLVGMGSVVLLCVVAAIVWANEVVPVSRTKLAISKSRGEVREYLDDLQRVNVDDYIDGEEIDIQSSTNDEITTRGNSAVVDDGRGFERWLFADWLRKPASKGGRQKEPALPILKDAKWNSGDNPVLVTAGIMMIGIVLASITERISS